MSLTPKQNMPQIPFSSVAASVAAAIIPHECGIPCSVDPSKVDANKSLYIVISGYNICPPCQTACEIHQNTRFKILFTIPGGPTGNLVHNLSKIRKNVF